MVIFYLTMEILAVLVQAAIFMNIHLSGLKSYQMLRQNNHLKPGKLYRYIGGDVAYWLPMDSQVGGYLNFGDIFMFVNTRRSNRFIWHIILINGALNDPSKIVEISDTVMNIEEIVQA